MNPAAVQQERFSLAAPMPLSALEGISANVAKGEILGLARFGHGQGGDLCFCDREPDPEIRVASGAFVLCPEDLIAHLEQRFSEATFLPVRDPRSIFIDICQKLLEEGGVHVSDAIPGPFGIHPTVRVGAQTEVHPESRIDENVVIGSHCVIHRGTWIKPGTIIRDHVTVGTEGINAYRGADGRQRRFPHLAGTIIGAGVEIGAGTVVVRGILNSTRIDGGTVIGNLCNIGHVVEIGEKVWMSVGCLIGGHSRIGAGATLGMGVAVKDNVDIGENAQVGMGSVVVKSVKAGASVFGNPARLVGPIQAGPAR